MRVAYLCHRIPFPPNKGDKIRAFHQLKAIAARHEVDLFTLADDPADLVYQNDLAEYCRQVSVAEIKPLLARIRALPFFLTSTALTLPYFYSSRLDAAFRDAVLRRSYDRIFVYCSAMAQYVKSEYSIPVLTDFVDVDSDKWTQYADHSRLPMSAVYRRESQCLRRYEQEICERSADVVVTTEREARMLREIHPRANVHVISNGVDTDYFTPQQANLSGLPAVAFTGDMSYLPNASAAIYFATEVLPIIRGSVPGIRFLVIGRNPGPEVKKLEALPGVTVTGSVPDIRSYMAQAAVFVAPLSIAAGIQNKTLEAMACGLPVVATPRAVQGLSPEIAMLVDVGTNSVELADKVIGLLRDPEIARCKGIEGRRRVIVRYGWKQPLDQLVEILENPSLRQPLEISTHPSFR